METMHNFIKALNIIEKYIVNDLRFPYMIDGYTISFRVDPLRMKYMDDEDKKALKELHFTVENNDIFTNQYTW
jgi:hypothetical protein